jgi:uncharacterized membrane protein YdjX (TVP38/TMEM64 family)
VTASQSSPNGDNGRTSNAAPTSRPVSWPTLAGLLAIGLTGLALWRWGGPLFAFFRDQDQIREWLAGFGPLAPLISIVLNIAQVLLAPVPGQVIGLANGYLFGVLWGTVYSLLGVMFGSALAMGLGRWLGRPIVERFVGSTHLARWDHLADRRGPLFFFLVFLLPLVPDDIACFAVGLSPLSIPYILALAVIGRLPGLIVSSWIGANASTLSPAGWVLVGAGTLVLAGLVLRYRDRVEARLLQTAERWSERS